MFFILRQVYIYKENKLIFSRNYGKCLTPELFESLINQIKKEALKGQEDKPQYFDYYNARVVYATSKELDLLFIFLTSLSIEFNKLKKELLKCKEEFIDLFEDILSGEFDTETFNLFHPNLDLIYRNLKPKISLVGFSGVGKTTTIRLIRAEEIPMEHIPTISGEVSTIKIGKLQFNLWDFAGQEQFSFLWNKFIQESDAVLIITDSTIENVDKSKFFLDLIQDESPNANVAVIGNKQDLPNALPVIEIEKILGTKTYSMVAIEPDNREKMINIIADILELSTDVSPLLKPLFERNRLMELAEKAFTEGNFSEALTYYEKISELCIDLGDNSLGIEFFKEIEKIKGILETASTFPNEIVKPTKIQTAIPQSSTLLSELAPADTPQSSIHDPQSQDIKELEAIINGQIHDQKSELEKTLMDLNIKLSNLSKMEIDLEMKEISGEITKNDFIEKKKRVKALKQNISEKIDETQKFLASLKK